jgi:phospholipid/cholesterol/gamma-HCH transport system substrate-binding protein
VGRPNLARAAALGALAIALVAVAVVIATAGSTYVLHAEFEDAGQLVSGDLVTVGGHQVGSVGSVTLAPNGLADVELDISEHGITPLRADTIATIGQLSLTGVANRFVALTPGMGGAAIPSGGTLPPTQTRGIVDLDTLLDALTPRVRDSLDGLLAAGAYLVAAPTAAQLNRANEYLNPAASQAAALGGEVASEDSSLSRLVAATGNISSTLAARSGDLAGAVSETAATLREIASERSALEDSIARAPAVLAQATGVLGRTDGALRTLDPALRSLQPAAPRLTRLIEALLPAAQNAIPTIRAVQGLVPGAEAALAALPGVAAKATPAVRSLTRALILLTPVLSGIRPYIPDVIAGFFNGVGGATAGSYDANGHYMHGLVTVQGAGSSLTGLLNLLGKQTSTLGPFDGERTGLLAPCPGGGNAPAADRSNPWTSPQVLPGAGNVCNPGDDQR